MSKIGNIYKSNGQAGNVYGINDVAPCVPGFSAGGGKEMKVLIKQATKQGYALCDVGGGGRFQLPQQQNKARKSARKWANLSDYNK